MASPRTPTPTTPPASSSSTGPASTAAPATSSTPRSSPKRRTTRACTGSPKGRPASSPPRWRSSPARRDRSGRGQARPRSAVARLSDPLRGLGVLLRLHFAEVVRRLVVAHPPAGRERARRLAARERPAHGSRRGDGRSPLARAHARRRHRRPRRLGAALRLRARHARGRHRELREPGDRARDRRRRRRRARRRPPRDSGSRAHARQHRAALPRHPVFRRSPLGIAGARLSDRFADLLLVLVGPAARVDRAPHPALVQTILPGHGPVYRAASPDAMRADLARSLADLRARRRSSSHE